MKTIKETILCLLCVLILASCTTVPEKEPIPQIERTPPAEALQLCPDLKELKDASFESIAKKLDEVSTEYYICSSKQKELKEWIESDTKIK